MEPDALTTELTTTDYPVAARRRQQRLAKRVKKVAGWYVPRRTGATFKTISARLLGDADAYMLNDALMLLSGGLYRKPGPVDGESLTFSASNAELRAVGLTGSRWNDERLQRTFDKLDSLKTHRIVTPGTRGQKRMVVFLGTRDASDRFIPVVLVPGSSNDAEEIAPTRAAASRSTSRSKASAKCGLASPQNADLKNSLEENDFSSRRTKKEKTSSSPKRASAPRRKTTTRSPARRAEPRNETRTRTEALAVPVPATFEAEAFSLDAERLPDSPRHREFVARMLSRHGGEDMDLPYMFGERDRAQYETELDGAARNILRDYTLGKASIWNRRGNVDAMGYFVSALGLLYERAREYDRHQVDLEEQRQEARENEARRRAQAERLRLEAAEQEALTLKALQAPPAPDASDVTKRQAFWSALPGDLLVEIQERTIAAFRKANPSIWSWAGAEDRFGKAYQAALGFGQDKRPDIFTFTCSVDIMRDMYTRASSIALDLLRERGDISSTREDQRA
jgi:hypothetical protein